MRSFLLISIAACLLPVSLFASTKQQKIDLHYRSVAEATEAIATQFGAEGASAVLTTDRKQNTITLRLDSPSATKVRAFLASIDHKLEQVQVKMTLIRKTKGTPGAPAREELLARPILIGTPGKPMSVSFDKDGETFQVDVDATVLKP